MLLPGFISGFVSLPPRGIKDAESVGNCAQVFFVCSCQPKSFELAVAIPTEDQIVFNPETAQRYEPIETSKPLARVTFAIFRQLPAEPR